MTAFRHYYEPSAGNGCHHLFSSVRRGESIAIADKDERGNGYGCKAGTIVDPCHDRLGLPRPSLDANLQTHAHIDFAQGRIVLVRWMHYRGDSQCQQRLEVAGVNLGEQGPALCGL